MQPFTDPDTVARYASSTPGKVPGFADLHRMAMLLLAEHVPQTANVLVVGAGGGLELKAFAEAQPGWHFLGADPSAEMLDLARRTLGPLQQRVDLHRGYIDSAPSGPYDGATCLLTLHFLERDERLRTLRQIHRRLKREAPLIVAHHTAPEGDLHRWLSRSIAFASEAPMSVDAASASASAMASRLPILSATEDEALLREAGVFAVALFYAGLA